MTRKYTRVVLTISVCATILATLGMSAGASETQAEDRCTGWEMSEAARNSGKTVEEVKRACRLSTAIGELINRARAEFPESFAGLWLEEGRGGQLKLAVTRGRLARGESALRSFPDRSFVDVVELPRSIAQLTSLVDTISSDVSTLESEGIAVSAVFVDASKNVVTLRVEGLSSEERVALQRRYGSDHLNIVEGSRAKALSCVTRFSCTPRFRGGLEIYGSGYACTSGFEGTRTNASNFGQPALITAGHCFPGGSTVYHAAISVGQVYSRNYVNGGCCDGEAITQPNPPWLPSNWVYYTDYIPDPFNPGGGNSTEYPITSRKAKLTEFLNENVCRTGISSPPSCGVIFATGDVNIDNGDGSYTLLRQQLFGSFCSIPGDSGGPVVFAGRAYGVVSAGTECGADQFTTWTNAQLLEEGTLSKIRTSMP